VEVELDRLTEELARIREEDRRLRDAESLWGNNHLTEARERFVATLDALLPEHRRQAEEGKRKVEARMRQFEALVQRGGGISDPVAAAHAYQEAYDLWPEGPEIARLLETTLVQACETALDAGRSTEAAGFGQRALELNPDSREAKRCVGKAGVKPRVEATLESVRSRRAALLREDEIHAEDWDPLLDELSAVLREADPWPDLRGQLAELHQEIRVLRQQWQQYDQHYTRAVHRRDAGEWREALDVLDEAIAVLGDHVPPSVEMQRETWAKLAQALERAGSEAVAALEAARTAYAEIADLESLTDIKSALEEVARTLAPAHKVLDKVQEEVEVIEGPVPASISNLQKQVSELDDRVTAATDAAGTFSASDGLLKIQEAIQMRGSDPTLEAVQACLKAKVVDKLASIKRQAETAIQVGDLTEAEDKLRQVRELDPSDTEVAQQYAQIRQRRKLEEKLRSIEREADGKLAGNSPVDAMHTLRRGLNAVLEPDVDLPERAREILSKLVALGDRDDGLALGQAENWQTAQDMTAELGSLRSENWIAGRIVPLVDQWIRLARDNALRGVVASAAQLGNLLEAYRGAAAYLKAHPTEAFAIQQLTERQESLINQLNESANKRIDRAQTALDDGDFEVALHNLRDIETDFYQPIEQEFSGLLDGYDQVQAVRDDVLSLQNQAEKLQALYNETQPKLEEARQAYQQSEWDTAEKALETLPVLKDVPDLDAQVKVLRAKIVDGRKEAARKQVQKAMSRIETGHNLATTTEALDAYVEELQEIESEVNLQLLDVDDHNRYLGLLEAVREQRESLATGAIWEEKIEGFVQDKNYADALNALDEALAVTRDAERIVFLKSRRREVERLKQEQEERETLLSQGQDFLSAGEYVQARQQFDKARRLGVEVAELLAAARAGALLESARRMWQELHDGESALLDLEELDELVKGNLAAESIAHDARYLRRKIEKALEGTHQEQRALNEARQLLEDGDLEAAQAKVRELLESTPDSKDAKALQTEIREHTIAHKMLEEARTAQSEGRHKDALQRVETVLGIMPTASEALLLKRQLEDITAADKAIIQVEMLAKQSQFKEARSHLTDLSRQGVDPEKLRDTQRMVEDLERAQWTKIIHPIESLYRDGEYAEALNRCRQALERTAAPELRDELEMQQNLIVNRWAEKQSQAVRSRLQRHPEEEDLREIEAELGTFMTLEPEPEGHWLRQIEDLLREARTRRLRGRILQAHERYEQWLSDGAAGIPQVVLDTIKAVQDEADELGPRVELDVTLDATSLETEVLDTLRQRDENQRRTERDDLLEKARTLQAQLQDPTYVAEQSPSRLALERVYKWAQRVFGIKGYEGDGEARELEAWAQEALKAFDRTEEALKAAKGLAGKRRLRDAEYELMRAGTVSLLLKSEHDRWRDLIGVLQRAEADQNNEQWAQALEGYRQVVKSEPGLEPLVNRDIERCYQNLLARVRETVSRALSQTPPDAAKAQETLTQAEEAGWITPLHSRDYEQLRSWLISLEKVAEAAEILQSENGNPHLAEQALEEAQRLLPREQSGTAIRQWKSLARALEQWQNYQENPGLLTRTLEVFDQLESPIADLPRVRALRQKMEAEVERRRIAAEEEVERRRLLKQEAAERMRLLDGLEQRVTTALTTPRDYAGAVKALENPSVKIVNEPQFKELCERVQSELKTAMEICVTELDYEQAIMYGELLKRIPGLDPELRSWVVDLSGQRRSALDTALQEARDALARHNEHGVQVALRDAETIAAPDGDARIGTLRKRLQDDKFNITLAKAEQALEHYEPRVVEAELEAARDIAGARDESRIKALAEQLQNLRTLLNEVQDGLRETRTLMGQKDWSGATERLLKVRNQAPGYPLMLDMIQKLQDQLVTQAETARSDDAFTQALGLCDLGLRLGTRDDLSRLQEQIRSDREKVLIDLRQQVKAGLDAWKLELVEELLQKGLTIAPDDAELMNLQNRFNVLNQARPEIRRAMVEGWNNLQSRNHTAAIAAFERALQHAPESLAESQVWRDYTRALREAIRLALEETNASAFDQAAQLLQDAASLVHLSASQTLPDIFGSEHHLRERHRHAAYNAWRLRQMARKMALWYKTSDEYFARGDSKSMEVGLGLFEQVQQEQKAFEQLHLNPIVPPDSFPTDGQPDTTLPDVPKIASVSPRPEPTAPSKPPMRSSPSLSSTVADKGESVVEEEDLDVTRHQDRGKRKQAGGLLGKIFGKSSEPDDGQDEYVGDLGADKVDRVDPDKTPPVRREIPGHTSPSDEVTTQSPQDTTNDTDANAPPSTASTMEEEDSGSSTTEETMETEDTEEAAPDPAEEVDMSWYGDLGNDFYTGDAPDFDDDTGGE
jgi:flagellin-specific chaperone FliS